MRIAADKYVMPNYPQIPYPPPDPHLTAKMWDSKLNLEPFWPNNPFYRETPEWVTKLLQRFPFGFTKYLENCPLPFDDLCRSILEDSSVVTRRLPKEGVTEENYEKVLADFSFARVVGLCDRRILTALGAQSPWHFSTILEQRTRHRLLEGFCLFIYTVFPENFTLNLEEISLFVPEVYECKDVGTWPLNSWEEENHEDTGISFKTPNKEDVSTSAKREKKTKKKKAATCNGK